MTSPRRFPPPWSAELQPSYYVVRDANGQKLAYIYYSNDPERRSAAKLLTKDEARQAWRTIIKTSHFPGGWSHARNSHFSRGHLSGACCSTMVGLSLTAGRIAANVAKLPELVRKP
jgi:hypothetical protein